MKKVKKVVFIGGGTGLSTVLSGVKQFYWDISAIVAMTDDGLSTGRIRRDFRTLPPGDIRKCLIALSSDEGLLKELFEYRFSKGKGLARHSLGNLLILALEKITGNFAKAIDNASEILRIKGHVIPSTLENISLAGKLLNEKTIVGERKLFLKAMHSGIDKVWLHPQGTKANPRAIVAINNADAIVIGPGSLYTSIIPNLLIKNISKAISDNKKAKKIYILNVSTERGETQKYTVDDHIKTLQNYFGDHIFDICIVNSKIITQSDKQYKLGEINNITTNEKSIYGCNIVKKNIINLKNPLYHDSQKLAKILKNIIN